MKMTEKKKQMRRRGGALALLFTAAAAWAGCAAVLPAPKTQTGMETSAQTDAAAAEAEQRQEGFYAVQAWKDGFLAAGSEGRIEKIRKDGTAQTLGTAGDTDFQDLDARTDQAAAVGEKGAVARISSEDKIESYRAKGAEDLESICSFAGDWLIGAEQGILLKTADFQSWESIQTEAEGTITGLAANDSRCIGVTDQGEILVTEDGNQWSLLDYNEYYGGDLRLQGIESIENVFWAFGTDQEGLSHVIMSTEGGVWTERMLQIYEGQECLEGAEFGVNCLAFDGEQVLAGCENGMVITLPSCTECNKTKQISYGPIYAAWASQDVLLTAGSQYAVDLTEADTVRQDGIKAEAARAKQREGAVLVDVRSQEEYDQKHIADSVHIPVDEVEAELPAQFPDRKQELIFYCASGARSQRAMETAKKLGYENVYNLGSMDAWPYDVVE